MAVSMEENLQTGIVTIDVRGSKLRVNRNELQQLVSYGLHILNEGNKSKVSKLYSRSSQARLLMKAANV